MTDRWTPSRRDVLAAVTGLAGVAGASESAVASGSATGTGASGSATAGPSGDSSAVRQAVSADRASESAGNGRWQSYRYDGGNAGHKPGVEPVVDGVEVGWSLSDSVDEVAGKGVAIADGTAYVTDDDQTLKAVDLETGEVSWQAGFEAESVGVPALTESKVLCYAGRLWAFEIGSGAVEWRSDPGNDAVVGSPAVVDGTVAVNAGGVVTGYDLSSGEQRWTHNLTGSVEFGEYVVTDGNRFYALVSRDAADHYDSRPVVALNPSDGSVVWSEGPSTDLYGPVVADGSVLYVLQGQQGPYSGGEDILYCLDADSGEQRWKREYDHEAGVTLPVVVDSRAIFQAGEKLRAVSLEGGITRWEHSGNVAPSFAVGSRLICMGGFGPGIEVRSVDTGKLETTLAGGLRIWDGGGYADGTFVVPAESGIHAIGKFNKPPSAAFDYDRPAYAGQAVSFDATSSTDGDGSVARYEWDFDAGGQFETTGERPSHTFDLPGEFDVSLRVTDDDGATDTTTRTVVVERAPTATPTPTQSPTPTATPTDAPTRTSASPPGATATETPVGDGTTPTPTAATGGSSAGGGANGGSGGGASGRNAAPGSGGGSPLPDDAPTRIAVFVAAISAGLSTAYVALRRLNDDEGRR